MNGTCIIVTTICLFNDFIVETLNFANVANLKVILHGDLIHRNATQACNNALCNNGIAINIILKVFPSRRLNMCG